MSWLAYCVSELSYSPVCAVAIYMLGILIAQKSKKELKREKKRKRKEEKKLKKQEKKDKKDKKSSKKVKSAGEPKKPKTPFLYFSMSQRKAVQEADPSLDFGALNKKLGELWKALDADGRREYEEQGNADRQRYEREMTAAGLKGMCASVRGRAVSSGGRVYV
jgi:hypothetical protein